jgi:hypothetical protein
MLQRSYVNNARPLLMLSEEEFQNQLDQISQGLDESENCKFYMRYNKLEVDQVEEADSSQTM